MKEKRTLEIPAAAFRKHYFKRLLNQRDMFKKQRPDLLKISTNTATRE